MTPIQQSLMNQVQARHQAPQFKATVEKVFQDAGVQAFLSAHEGELTSERIQRDYSKLYEYYHEKDLQARGQSTLAPGYEPRLVINAGQIDVTYTPSVELLAQQKALEIANRVERIEMPKVIEQASIDQFFTSGEFATPSRQAAQLAALQYLAKHDPNQTEPGLYLYGNFGVGKTYLLGAIANELAAQGVSTVMLHYPSFLVKMREAIQDGTLAEKRQHVCEAPVLMIDDIGAETVTAWGRDEILGVILEYRLHNNLPTFFSSNLDWEALEQHLAEDNKGVVEPMKAKRLMQRIMTLSKLVTLDGRNLRMR